jgi:hypothetical protein
MDQNTFNVIIESQEIRVYLQTSAVDENGVHYLTAKAITPAEWDHEIDGLIRHLELARSRGHRLLEKLWSWSPGIKRYQSMLGNELLKDNDPGKSCLENNHG